MCIYISLYTPGRSKRINRKKNSLAKHIFKTELWGVPDRVPMGSIWVSHGIPMGPHGVPIESPWDPYCIPKGSP